MPAGNICLLFFQAVFFPQADFNFGIAAVLRCDYDGIFSLDDELGGKISAERRVAEDIYRRF